MGLSLSQHPLRAALIASALGAAALVAWQSRSVSSTRRALEAAQAPVQAPPPTLLDILPWALPALGPEGAYRARQLASAARDLVSKEVLRGIARLEWQQHLEGALSPLVELAAVAGGRRALARAMVLGSLCPGGEVALWAPDRRGRPPLVALAALHCKAGGRAPLESLLLARAEPNGAGADGWTALMWASHLGDLDGVKVLLQSKASTGIVARDGSSALLLATRADAHPLAIVKLLLSHGADPDLAPMQSPFDEHVDMDVRQALKDAKRRRS